MKYIKHFFTGIIVCGVAMVMVSNSWAQNDKPIPAKVVRIKGAARYTTDNKVWHPLEQNMVLKPGTTIQTGEGSQVDIILGEGNVDPNPAPISDKISYNPKAEQNLVRLWDNTTMAIDKLTQMQMGADTMTDTELDLRAGRVFGTVKKLSATSRYEVKIPNGVAGIRGTIYMVSASGIISVLEGSVMISYLDANGNPATQEVGAGYEFDTRTGEIKEISGPRQGEMLTASYQSGPITVTPIPTPVAQTVYDISPVVP